MTFLLPKPTISLNGPFKVVPVVVQFREVLLYTTTMITTLAENIVISKSVREFQVNHGLVIVTDTRYTDIKAPVMQCQLHKSY